MSDEGEPPSSPLAAPGSFTFSPIGVVRTPFTERLEAPRQPPAAARAEGTIELFPGRGFEHALEDVEGWGYLWVVFVFHLNEHWRPKVLPPRSSGKRRGLFSTRSPHRPNPIGLSAVELLSVSGLTLRVRGVDMVDGSPVLDLKPYVPYADSIPDAKTGWLGEAPEGAAEAPLAAGGRPADPRPDYRVTFGAEARAQLAFLRDSFGLELEGPVAQALSLGPQPHPYRRIRAEGEGYRLSFKDWRVRFRVEGREVIVLRLDSGYRPSQLALDSGEHIAPHQAFVARFGMPPAGG